MNTGRFYIDGRDAYGEYRVLLLEGSVESLLAYPSLKKTDSTDWPEEDGEEVDLTAPRLDTRNVTLKFLSHDAGGRDGRFGGFVALLSDMAYHDFRFPAFGDRAYRLRLTAQNAMERWRRRADVFTLQFADDFPPCCGEGYRRAEPESTVAEYRDYEMDGRPLTYYGVRVLEGSLAEVLKSPAVKSGLTVKADGVNGVTYDGGTVRFKTKDVKLDCLMRAADFTEFWKSYETFLYDLARPDGEVVWTGGDVGMPGARTLHADATGMDYPCHYKSCSSKEFAVMPGKIWWRFTLTLVFTSFRVREEELRGDGADGISKNGKS